MASSSYFMECPNCKEFACEMESYTSGQDYYRCFECGYYKEENTGNDHEIASPYGSVRVHGNNGCASIFTIEDKAHFDQYSSDLKTLKKVDLKNTRKIEYSRFQDGKFNTKLLYPTNLIALHRLKWTITDFYRKVVIHFKKRKYDLTNAPF